jgi:hypothetical protein
VLRKLLLQCAPGAESLACACPPARPPARAGIRTVLKPGGRLLLVSADSHTQLCRPDFEGAGLALEAEFPVGEPQQVCAQKKEQPRLLVFRREAA